MNEAPDVPCVAPRIRMRIELRGRVQGVGFRPFVCRLARTHSLAGWVRNHPAGVSIEVEGDPKSLDEFARELERGTPASSAVRCESCAIPALDEVEFRIIESGCEGAAKVFIPPDLAVCEECLREMRDPANRRHRYPFINCSHCGPRYSIVKALPYDRPQTSMVEFEMCAECRAEYESSADRRFHAEPIACPNCGPMLEWRGKDGLARAGAALNCALTRLRCGDILAVKGVSGFHLMADARSETAVRRLREIKRREAKPFALMYPNLARLECDVVLNDAERAALLSPEAPIVLVERRAEADLAESIAPHNPLIGAMIAYSPLHHLLLDELGGPIIATSANFGEEPIIILNAEAERVFGDLVDGILMHDRDILRRADDSIIRIIDDTPCPIRIGRGMSPVCIEIPGNRNPGGEGTILALGGHEKSSIALAKDGAIYLSRHLGDLDTPASREAYREAVSDFLALYDCRPDLIVCDLHPDYFSTRVGIELAREFGCELLRVQHHAAHLYSLILELENSSQANLSFFGVRELAPAFVPAGCRQTMGFNLARASLRLESGGKPPHSKEAPAHIRPMDESGEGNLAGICWDGTGLGTDGDIWGAEWLLFDTDSASGFRRAASLLPIPLPGGETCVREPWRIALALAHESGVSPEAAVLSPDQSGFLPERAMRIQVEKLIAGRRNSVPASSMGRLFDGVASLLGLRHRAQFSAQPAMELEFLAMGLEAHRLYEIPILRGEAAHFGVRELAPAFDMAACRRDSRVQFARASSRSESGGKPPHSKVGDLQPRGQTDNGPPSIPQFTLDWRPMIREMIADFSRGVEAGRIAAAFHESLAAACAHLARELRIGTAFLTGGCFQNKLLAESVARRLRESGIAAVTHSIFPPNDGGLAAGQALLGWRHRLM